MAEKNGYTRVTRDEVAAHAQCSPALVSHYLGTMPDLRRDVMRAAVKRGILPVIAQGLAAKDRHALKASEELKKAALATLVA